MRKTGPFQNLICCALVVLTGSGFVIAEDWNQWRGPKRDGSYTSGSWPTSLSETNLQQKWRLKLGPSYSSPIVTKDAVFVTETRNKEEEVVRALSRETGEQLWEASWEGAMKVPFFANANGSWIRSTPAYDGKTLYVAGMRDVLVALDGKTGEIRWKLDFMKSVGSPLPAFGFVASPLVKGNAVYVQAGSSLAKVNKNTGEILWRTLKDQGGMNGSAFSSPIVATLQGKEQLVVQTRTALAGVDPEDGTVLWSQPVPAFRGMNILTPTIIGDRVFTSTYGGGSFLFEIQKENDTFTVKELWKNKVQGYMSSPVVIDGHVYLHLRNRRFACIELESGKEKWITRPYGQYWSLISRNNQILALDQKGDLMLIKANPEKFELLETRHLSDDPTWAHLALQGNEAFVRELNAMTVYEWK